MGYVFSFHDAIAYEQWFNRPQNRFVFDLEKRLMFDMLKPARGDSVVDIGCGIGANLLSFTELGLQATGIDPSPYMLDIAAKNLGNRADLHRGFAENLPFDDNSFNYACLVTTLEFVDNPQKALEEACRVTKDKIFIGVLNRYAIKGIQRRIKGVFFKTVYNRANFFSVWELKQIIRTILGDVPISWKTTCRLPIIRGNIASGIEQLGLLQKCPFGAFAGMVVTLVPRYKTRTLPLRYDVKQTIDTPAS
ncbi:MAG: class I SAM-dependent methyltransferase [Candidatus Desulfaltia sp.]|nr:class I SAM-dependent methyltransferase [Candidatus Desulfaltia sp.]